MVQIIIDEAVTTIGEELPEIFSRRGSTSIGSTSIGTTPTTRQYTSTIDDMWFSKVFKKSFFDYRYKKKPITNWKKIIEE